MSLAPANPRLPMMQFRDAPIGIGSVNVTTDHFRFVPDWPVAQPLDSDALSAADLALRDAELLHRRYGRHARREDRTRLVLATVAVMLGATALVGVAWALLHGWQR